jgi:hypothetical protein
MQQLNGSLETSNPNQPPRNSNSGETAAKPSKQEGKQQNQQQQPTKGGAEGDTVESKPLSLAEMFTKENPDDPDDHRFSVEEPDDPSKPVDSIDGLAKRLKMKPEDIYAIKVPLGNGAEPMTLGELKDSVGELANLDARALEFDQRRVASEGEILRAQQELRGLMALIPKQHLSPELVDKVRKNHVATQARERQLTLEHIPAWENEEVRTKEIEDITKMFSDYGFDDGFVTTIVDHRAMKFARDTMLMRKRIAKALAEVKIPPRKSKTPSGKTAKPAVKPSESSTGREKAVGANANLRALFSQD